MGYIPFFIALLAFVVLVILVNINSIRASQQSVGLALFTVCQTAKSRNALLRRLRGVHANMLCPSLPNDHRLLPGLFPQINTFILAEWTSIDDSNFFLQETNIPDAARRYVPALEVLNHRQQINLRILERKVREYNQLLNKNPTALVASLYRIKPIKLSSVRKHNQGPYPAPGGGTM